MGVRKATYGITGVAPFVVEHDRRRILEGVEYVVSESSASFRDAAVALLRAWFKRPGRVSPQCANGYFRENHHPLRFLAQDVSEVTVDAVKSLAKQKPLKKALPREPEPQVESWKTAVNARELLANLNASAEQTTRGKRNGH
jgi:hypothetical protein